MTPFPLLIFFLEFLYPPFSLPFRSGLPPHWSPHVFGEAKRMTWLPDSGQDVFRRFTSALPYYSLFPFLLSSPLSPPYLCL